MFLAAGDLAPFKRFEQETGGDLLDWRVIKSLAVQVPMKIASFADALVQVLAELGGVRAAVKPLFHFCHGGVVLGTTHI